MTDETAQRLITESQSHWSQPSHETAETTTTQPELPAEWLALFEIGQPAQ